MRLQTQSLVAQRSMCTLVQEQRRGDKFLLVRDLYVRHRLRRFDPYAKPEDQRLFARRGNRVLAC